MNCKISRWLLIMPAVLTLASCGTDNAQTSKESPKRVESGVEQPIDIVVKHEETSADIAPIQTTLPAVATEVLPPVTVDIPAVIPPIAGPGPVFLPPPPPPPIPVGIVVDEGSCEDVFCGDGHRDENEECDDGNEKTDDNCDKFCRKIRCGNSRVEGDEECDNPDNVNCTEECTLALCGNGRIDEGETCDPPNEESICNATCLTSVCGNGIVEFGEECDDDNSVETDGCNNACELGCPTTNGNGRK